jgi:hypothetical protein
MNHDVDPMAKDLTCSAGIENKYEESRKKWFGAFTYKIDWNTSTK